jgi:hypothetical protein
MNVFVNVASNFDCNTDPEYIRREENSSSTEDVEETSSIRGKCTVLNYLRLKIGLQLSHNLNEYQFALQSCAWHSVAHVSSM